MKRFFVTGLAASLLASAALAGDLEEYCVGYTTENNGDPSGCACLAEAADDAMTEELLAVASEEDMEALSGASKEAIASCWPDA